MAATKDYSRGAEIRKGDREPSPIAPSANQEEFILPTLVVPTKDLIIPEEFSNSTIYDVILAAIYRDEQALSIASKLRIKG